jgi:hypothetical protein
VDGWAADPDGSATASAVADCSPVRAAGLPAATVRTEPLTDVIRGVTAASAATTVAPFPTPAACCVSGAAGIGWPAALCNACSKSVGPTPETGAATDPPGADEAETSAAETGADANAACIMNLLPQ